MVLPTQRLFNGAAGTNNVVGVMTDSETNLTALTLTQPNKILDAVYKSIPSNSSVEFYIYKNSTQTPIRFYSETINPAQAGRVAVGPINLGPGLYQFYSKQTAGTAGAKSLLIVFAKPPV